MVLSYPFSKVSGSLGAGSLNQLIGGGNLNQYANPKCPTSNCYGSSSTTLVFPFSLLLEGRVEIQRVQRYFK